MNRKTLIVSLLIIAGTLILMGTTYAYFTAIATSNEQAVESGTLELTYLTNQNISLENAFPGEESEAGIHQFAIENTGTLDATYYMYLDNITLKKGEANVQSENLKWKLYKANESYVEQEEIANGNFSDGNNTIEMNTNIAIEPSEKQYYILKIWLQETGALQNEDQGLIFSGQVVATTEKKAVNKSLANLMKQEAVLDNIASTYVTSDAGIDFSQISSDTNGKGLYILNGTENNQYPIMYYRGDVENNNVKFANFCWKIVRTTETGGVKLIYNGEPNESGQCMNTTGSSTTIGTSTFNASYNDNAYVGYMYGITGASSYEETHANTNDSTIKGVIDSWYEENMTEYTNQLEDTVWCSERSITLAPSSIGPGTNTSSTAYLSRYRLVDNQKPSFVCKNVNDQFTVSENNGNGELIYPVSLLTSDEVAYAGGVYHTANNSYFLYNDFGWWLLSPSYFNGTKALVFFVYAGGLSDYTVDSLYGIRPAISLKVGTTVISGDGTSSNPYEVR